MNGIRFSSLNTPTPLRALPWQCVPRNTETTTGILRHRLFFIFCTGRRVLSTNYSPRHPRATNDRKKCHRPRETHASFFPNGQQRKLAAGQETHALLSRLLSVDFFFILCLIARGADANTKEDLFGQYSQCATSRYEAEIEIAGQMVACLQLSHPACSLCVDGNRYVRAA